jgi:molecular chaperone GrpE
MNDQGVDLQSKEPHEQQKRANEPVSEPTDKALEKMTKEELLEKARDLQKESDKNYDLYLRSQAEMENLRKRFRREKEDYLKFSNESLIREMLPVIDNLEKALSHSDNENNVHALKEGIGLTLKGLKDSLSKSGLEEVKALGETFDPCFHEAVSEMEDPKESPGIVLTELQKGYTLNTRLIRPAMVVVNRQKASHEPDQGNPSDRACERIKFS